MQPIFSLRYTLLPTPRKFLEATCCFGCGWFKGFPKNLGFYFPASPFRGPFLCGGGLCVFCGYFRQDCDSPVGDPSGVSLGLALPRSQKEKETPPTPKYQPKDMTAFGQPLEQGFSACGWWPLWGSNDPFTGVQRKQIFPLWFRTVANVW